MIRNTCRLGVRSRVDTYFFFVLHLRHLQRPTSSLPCTSDSKNSARGMRVRAWCANTQYKGAAGRGGATRGRRQVGVRRSAYDEDCRGEKKTRVTDVCDVQVVRFRAACEMMMIMMVRRLYHGIALTGEAAPCSRPRIMWSARREGRRLARCSVNDEFRFISGCFPGEPRYRPPSLPPPPPPRPVSGAGLVAAPPGSTRRNDNSPPAPAGVTGADAGDCCVFSRRRRKGAVDTAGLGRLPGFKARISFARSALLRAENAPPASDSVPFVRSFSMNSSSRESVCGAMLCRRRTIRDVGAHVSGVLSVASSPFMSSSDIGWCVGYADVAARGNCF